MYRILHSRSPWLSLTVLCFGLGLLLIDLFAVNVALPAVGRSFGADLSEVEWIVTVYVLMWMFVLSRIVHAVVHVTSNRLAHRTPMFLVGAIALALIWIIISGRIFAFQSLS